MPTYQYACTDCGHELEAVQSFTDDALTECPQCGGTLRKRFGSVGVVFKGSGFYRTDSRSSGSATDKPAEKSAAKTAASTADATPAPTADSTSAPKPAPKSAPKSASTGSGTTS